MNEQVQLISQITIHLQAATECLQALAKTLQTEVTPSTVTLSDEDPRVGQLYSLAKAKIVRADGEWVRWHDLRPAHRDRDQYGDRVMSAVFDDPEVEIRTRVGRNGILVHEVRYEPLL